MQMHPPHSPAVDVDHGQTRFVPQLRDVSLIFWRHYSRAVTSRSLLFRRTKQQVLAFGLRRRHCGAGTLRLQFDCLNQLIVQVPADPPADPGSIYLGTEQSLKRLPLAEAGRGSREAARVPLFLGGPLRARGVNGRRLPSCLP